MVHLSVFLCFPIWFAVDVFGLCDRLIRQVVLIARSGSSPTQQIILKAANIDSANLNVLRCFRLLRVFKLARSWKELNRVLTTVLNSLSSIGYLSLLLLLFIFMMAVLGMQVLH